MRILAWRGRTWWRRLLLLLTIAATIALLAHPELRLFVPLLDSIGLDLTIVLIGSQLLDFASPLLLAIHRHALLPGAALAYRFVIFMLGYAGPYFDALLTLRVRSQLNPPIAAV